MIKIYSDGTAAGTKVFQEDGAEIRGITSITWAIEGGYSAQSAKATLTFENVEVEVQGVDA